MGDVTMTEIMEVLLSELKKTQKELIKVSSVSGEKIVQHYLNGIYKDLDELVLGIDGVLEENRGDIK